MAAESPALSELDIARFWSRVAKGEPSACWEWSSTRSMKGYGCFYFGRRSHPAHRVAYRLVKGEIPPGLMVRHGCDNPPCCNPAHLEVGDAFDNMADAVKRGRIAHGERNGKTRLAAADVAYMRANPERLSQRDLGARFGVQENTVWQIVSGRRWKHLLRT